MSPTVYYIRHGQTDWNAEWRFQGRRDIPLNENGRNQASENGEKLAALLPDLASMTFISSPMVRAVETMELVRGRCGLSSKGYQLDERLIEATYGDWEGTTLAEIKAMFPEIHARRKRERWTFQPPGGESHAMIEERVGNWYNSLEGDCVVTAHGVVGRVLRYLLLDLAPQEAGEFVFPQNQICEITRGREIFH